MDHACNQPCWNTLREHKCICIFYHFSIQLWNRQFIINTIPVDGLVTWEGHVRQWYKVYCRNSKSQLEANWFFSEWNLHTVPHFLPQRRRVCLLWMIWVQPLETTSEQVLRHRCGILRVEKNSCKTSSQLVRSSGEYGPIMYWNWRITIYIIQTKMQNRESRIWNIYHRNEFV